MHERLYRDADIRMVDLSAYLTDVCHDLSEVAAVSNNVAGRFPGGADVFAADVTANHVVS